MALLPYAKRVSTQRGGGRGERGDRGERPPRDLAMTEAATLEEPVSVDGQDDEEV